MRVIGDCPSGLRVALLPAIFLAISAFLSGCASQTASGPAAQLSAPVNSAPATATAEKAPGQTASLQTAAFTGPIALPAENLLACFQREAVIGRHETLLSLAGREASRDGAGALRNARYSNRQFSSEFVRIGPDLVARYAHAVTTTARQASISPTGLNARLKRTDLACLRTQITAAQSLLETTAGMPDANAPVDKAGLRNFLNANKAALHQLDRTYEAIAHYVEINDQDDITEQIARGFHPETLTLVDNAGLLRQLKKRRTAQLTR